MSTSNIYVTLVRPGKTAKTVEVPNGATVEDALLKAGISSSDYNAWSFTDEDGDSLRLADTLANSTQIICGQRVEGALVAA